MSTSIWMSVCEEQWVFKLLNGQDGLEHFTSSEHVQFRCVSIKLSPNHHVRGSCGTQRESSHFQPATEDPKRCTNISDVKKLYKDPLMCKTSIAVIPRRTISTRIGDHRILFGEVTVGITTEYTTLHAALQSTVFSGLVVMHNAAAMTSRSWRVQLRDWFQSHRWRKAWSRHLHH